MLIALLMDVHGNIDALEAVLRDAEGYHPDAIVFGGDLVMNGPKPRETLDRIIALGSAGVCGNTDDEVLRGIDPAGKWTHDHLSQPALDYLAALPIQHRITPPGGASPQDDLMVVHASPRSNNDLLVLEIDALSTSFKEVTAPAEAVSMLAGANANLIVYGHIHYFSNGVVGIQRVSSIGSVGFPFDGDTGAAYALARWDNGGWHIQPMRVPYDHERTAQDIEQSGQPLSARYAAMLRQSQWLPKPT